MKAKEIKPGELFLYCGFIWLKMKSSEDYVDLTEAVMIDSTDHKLFPHGALVHSMTGKRMEHGDTDRILNTEDVYHVDADFFEQEFCIHRTWAKKDLTPR